MFVIEIGVVEAFRSNQKVFERKPSYQPSAIGARGPLIAIGGEVRSFQLPEKAILICVSCFLVNCLGSEDLPERMGRDQSQGSCST